MAAAGSELGFVNGTSARPEADTALLKEAGIGWLRVGFGLPFADRVGGRVSDGYRKARARAEAWRAAGFGLMGITPGPGGGRYERDAKGRLQLVWRSSLPEWFGEPGSGEYLRNYEATCRWMAEDLRGLVRIWQIANELDIEIFAGPLSPPQACEYIAAGARGLKAADPALLVGHNPTTNPIGYYLYGRLYGCTDSLMDYCGTDAYYGTWAPGGPESWDRQIRQLHELTRVPILINEWGFSSAGELAPESDLPEGQPNCSIRKWTQSWGPGHTPQGQAEFVAGTLAVFRRHRDKLLGQFFYRWEDQEACWQCGSADCPIEMAWGLVDLRGRPKPSFHAFRDGVAALKS